MLIFLSPAKKMQIFSSKLNVTLSTPQFVKEANFLVSELKKYNPVQLQKLLKTNPVLTQNAFEMYGQWSNKPLTKSLSAAIYSFIGDAYRGFDATSFNQDELKYANQHLRILSAIYGYLKPLDLIQPYRLDLNNNFRPKGTMRLFDFWKAKVNKAIKKDIKEQNIKYLVNLASKEYSALIDFQIFGVPVLTPEFKELKNDRLQFVSVNAKMARGKMAAFILKNKITDPQHLQTFEFQGYRFKKNENNHLLFVKNTYYETPDWNTNAGILNRL